MHLASGSFSIHSAGMIGFRRVTQVIARPVRSVWTGGSGIVRLATSAHTDLPSRVQGAEGFQIRTMIRYAMAARLKSLCCDRGSCAFSLLEICNLII
jgi:hypothetical protein